MGQAKFGLGMCVLLATFSTHKARATPTLDELRQRDLAEYVAELRQLSPNSVGTFEQASKDYYADRYAEALRGFEAVHRDAPTFSTAVRRMCNCEQRLGHRSRAIELCRDAAKTERADNLSSLAMVLAYPGAPSTPDEQREAQALAARTVELEPSNPWSHVTVTTVALASGDLMRVHRSLPKLEEVAPRDVAASLYLGFAETLLGDKTQAQLDTISEAKRAIGRAETLGAEPVAVAQTTCRLALAQNDQRTLSSCSNTLLTKAPQLPQSHYLAAIAKAAVGELAQARNELDEAERLGLPHAQTVEFRKNLDDAEPFYKRWLSRVSWTLGVWLGGFALLTVIGMVLSRVALRASVNVPTESSGRAVGMTSGLRGLYGAVLWLTCIYYYVSMPLVVLSVFAIGGGLIYLFFAIGHIPIKLVIIIGLLVLATFWAILKSLLVRPIDEDPGQRLELSQHPKLREVLEEVAAKVGTRTVDKVFLTPGTDIAVFERGSLAAQLRQKTDRCLILGAGVIQAMPVPAFKSILAHEYGHFSNRDTAGGGFALAVRRSLMTMARGLAMAGAAAPYNPAWIFVINFDKLFLRISHGASRLQEVLADRWAAFAYGSENFVAGFTHVIRASVAFDAHIQSVLSDVIDGKKPLRNLYRYEIENSTTPSTLEEDFDTAMSREASAFDSHPSPKERIAWVQSLNVIGPFEGKPTQEVWDLFETREYLETEMTAQVRTRVREAHGVEIAPE
jgi:Zn-dependent protease with chaperone function/tetratricopeptide (TPR) repeat protein